MLGFMLGVALGMSFFRPRDLNAAVVHGNVEAVRLILTSSAMHSVDLDRALRVSAGLGRLDLTKLLVEHGASDMEGALTRAASQNQMAAIRWLVSPERTAPATDLSRAIKVACRSGSAEAEFFLLTLQRHPTD